MEYKGSAAVGRTSAPRLPRAKNEAKISALPSLPRCAASRREASSSSSCLLSAGCRRQVAWQCCRRARSPPCFAHQLAQATVSGKAATDAFGESAGGLRAALFSASGYHNLWRAAAAKSTKISARTPADSLRPCVFHLLVWQASPGQAADVHAVQLRCVAVTGLSQSLTVRDCSRTISLRPRLNISQTVRQSGGEWHALAVREVRGKRGGTACEHA